jgi:MFS transporter, ACS family, aldohexuronate transporter
VTGKWRVLALMTGAQAGASIVQQAIGVLAPFLIVEFALNQAQLGAMFTMLYLGSACFTAFSGVLTDRFGERTMVGASGGVMTVALIASALAPNYVWLVAGMGLFGAGYAASTPAGGRAILSWFDRDRGFAMGIRQTGVPVGGFVGAMILPFAALHFGGYRAALLVAAALVVITTAIACIGYREAAGDRPPPSRFRDVLAGMRRLARDPRLIAVTLTCMALVNGQLALNGFLTITAVRAVGVTPALAATAFACAFIAAIVARLFWGWYSDRFMRENRVVLLAVLSALSAVASMSFALLRPPEALLLIPAAVLLGFFAAGWNGVMAAAMAEIGGADRAGSALGLALTAIFGASAAGPLAFGAIADHTSLDTAWMVNAGIGLLGVLPVLWLRSHERRTREQAA